MASLALGVAGAAIGGTIAPGVVGLGLTGAGIGWLAGSTLGTLLFSSGEDQVGPRLSDTSIDLGGYGTDIPSSYGTFPHDAQFIWSTGRREREHEEDAGGKGSQPTVTTFTYDASFLVHVCAGVRQVKEIYLNNDLFYSASPDANGNTIYASTSKVDEIRIYDGREDQLPDPLYEADVPHAPAHRGYVTIMFDTLQLADFGNDLPRTIRVVVAENEQPAPHVIAEISFSDRTLQPFKEGWEDNQGLILHKSVENDGAVWRRSTEGFDLTGALLFSNRKFKTKSTQQKFKVFANSAKWIYGISASAADDIMYYEYDGGIVQEETIHSPPGFGGNEQSSGEGELVSGAQIMMSKLDALGNGYFFTFGKAGNGDKILCKFEIINLQIVGRPASFYHEAGFNSINLSNTQFRFILDDQGRLYFAKTDATGSIIEIILFDDDLNILSRFTSPPSMFLSAAWSVYNDRLFLWDSNYDITAYIFPATDSGAFALEKTLNLPASGRGALHVGNGVAVSEGVLLSLQPTASSDPVAIADIVADQCDKSGLTQYDVSLLTDTTSGFGVQRASTARSTIEVLQKAFLFDSVLSDGVIKFVPRGGAIAASIPDGDLIRVSAGGLGDTERVEALEMPRSISVEYLNAGAAFETGIQRESSILSESKNDITIRHAIVMSHDQARQLAAKLMSIAYTERETTTRTLPRQYSFLEPTDCVIIAGKRWRINTASASGQQTECSLVRDNVNDLISTATGAATIDASSQVRLPGATGVVMMDLPMLNDSHNIPMSYAAVFGFLPGWSGAGVYQSTDGSAWTQAASTTNSAIVGRLNTNHVVQNTATLDMDMVINVAIGQRFLSSTSLNNLLNFSNAAAIGRDGQWSIIQYLNADQQLNGTWNLSGILHGRRGTENITAYGNGDWFVVLNESVVPVAYNQSDIGTTKLIKAVTFGDDIASSETQQYIVKADTLRPYAPYKLRSSQQPAGVLLEWNRRDRLLPRTLWPAAMSEDTEQYTVEIVKDDEVVRTIVVDEKSYLYTDDDQATDLGQAGAGFDFNVYQNSAVYGRGNRATSEVSPAI